MSITPEQLLACPMDPSANDAEADSIGVFLTRLLLVLWNEGESFSGKRPFGNSGWEHQVYEALVGAGLVPGELDEDGFLDWADTREADRLVGFAIRSLYSPAHGRVAGAPAGAGLDE